MLPLVATALVCLAVWLLAAAQRGWIGPAWHPSAWTDRLPWLAFLVVVIGAVWGYEFWNRKIGPLPVTIDRLLWGLLMLEMFRQWSLGRWRLRPLQPVDWLVLGLFLTLVVSTLTHDFRDRDSLPLSRLLFFNLMPFGLYLVARFAPLADRDMRAILWGTAGFGAYLALTGIAEWRGWNAWVWPRYIVDPNFTEFYGRARGPFLNPIVNGTFLIAGLIAAAWCVSTTDLRRRWWWMAVIAASLLGIYATLTRSVWLTLILVVAGAAWLFVGTRGRGLLLIGGTLVVAGLFAVAGSNLNSFKRDKFVSEEDMSESAALRPLLAQVAWRMFLDKPVVGHGFGQYSAAKRLYHQQVTDEPLKKVLPYMQHNVVLSYLTETGLIGVLLLVGIWGAYAHAAWRLTRVAWGRPAGMIGLVGGAILVAYIVNGMFHDVSIMPAIGSLYFLFLGLMANLTSPQLPLSVQQHVQTQ